MSEVGEQESELFVAFVCKGVVKLSTRFESSAVTGNYYGSAAHASKWSSGYCGQNPNSRRESKRSKFFFSGHRRVRSALSLDVCPSARLLYFVANFIPSVLLFPSFTLSLTLSHPTSEYPQELSRLVFFDFETSQIKKKIVNPTQQLI